MYADRALAIMGHKRNSVFHSTIYATLRIADTTPGSSATKANCQSDAARQITELMNAASTRYRFYLGASSYVPFPAFTDESDKAASMQVETKTAHQLLTVIGRVAPNVLQSGGETRSGGGAAAVGDDDDDGGDDVGGGGDSKAAKKKRGVEARLEQQANRDRKAAKQAAGNGGGGSGRGSRGFDHGTPGEFSDRVQSAGDIVTFTCPSRDNTPKCTRSFDAGAVKADLTESGVENADEVYVPFQFKYAMSSNFGDDGNRLTRAYRYCPCPQHDGHDSAEAAAHEQAEWLDRRLISNWES